jgi:NAD(P)-dependent dehydrogenase (short-subunit alcohol dehydrogenase family)
MDHAVSNDHNFYFRRTVMSDSTPVILITGSAKRIGRAIALHMARSGWRVALHYRTSKFDALATQRDCERYTEGSQLFCTNFKIENEVASLVPNIVAQMGRLDAIVNNASIFPFDEAQSFTYEALQANMFVNAAAPICLANSFYHYIKNIPREQPYCEGVVVNILDQKLWNLNSDFFSYTLSKSALETATTLMAKTLAPLIRVAGVAPGTVLKWDGAINKNQNVLKAHSGLLPLHRLTDLEDLVSAIHFVITNRSITGSTILLDAGQHLVGTDHDPLMIDDA